MLRESFEGMFFRAIFPIVVGVLLGGIGIYSATQFTEWRRKLAIFVALGGVAGVVAGLAELIKIGQRLGWY